MLTFDVEHNRKKAFISMGVVLVLALIFPFIAQQFGNAWVRIIDMALLYIMLALGLNIVVGFAGLLDLGYIAFYAVGAYLTGGFLGSHYQDIFAFVVLILVLTVRPSGIMGERVADRA